MRGLGGNRVLGALNLATTITIRISTKSEITVMIGSRIALWNHWVFSAIGVAGVCRPICQGEGCPMPARAAEGRPSRPGARQGEGTKATRIPFRITQSLHGHRHSLASRPALACRGGAFGLSSANREGKSGARARLDLPQRGAYLPRLKPRWRKLRRPRPGPGFEVHCKPQLRQKGKRISPCRRLLFVVFALRRRQNAGAAAKCCRPRARCRFLDTGAGSVTPPAQP